MTFAFYKCALHNEQISPNGVLTGETQLTWLSGKTAIWLWNSDSPERSSVKGRTGLSCSCFKLKRQFQQVYSLSSDRDIPRWSADRPNPKWWIRLFTAPKPTQASVCFVTPKYKVTSCTPDPSMRKQRKELEEKVSFFSTRKAVRVCVCEPERVCLHACEANGGKVRARREQKRKRERKRPLIRWSQLITFSPPDGRHSSNLWPSGPSASTVRSLIEGKQGWVYAGHRNRWVWGGDSSLGEHVEAPAWLRGWQYF